VTPEEKYNEKRAEDLKKRVSGAPASEVERLERAIFQALEDRAVSNEEYAGLEAMANQIAPATPVSQVETLFRKPRVSGIQAGEQARTAASYLKTLAGVEDPTRENLREAEQAANTLTGFLAAEGVPGDEIENYIGNTLGYKQILVKMLEEQQAGEDIARRSLQSSTPFGVPVDLAAGLGQ